MTVPLRAAFYLRVSTARQAEHDVSIPDQKRQGEAYCAARGYELVETDVEPGASAADDRRPEFQRMIEACTSKPAPFDIVIVHSFSRFFGDHFECRADRVPEIAPDGMAKLAATVLLRKYNPDWEDEPRVPAGNPDGGQWTSDGVDGATTSVGDTRVVMSPECEEEWAKARIYCGYLRDRGWLGKHPYIGHGRTYDQCVRGQCLPLVVATQSDKGASE